MNRNVTILIIILIIVLIAGYLVWLRGRFQASQPEVTPPITTREEIPTPTTVDTLVTPVATGSPTVTSAASLRSATSSGKTGR